MVHKKSAVIVDTNPLKNSILVEILKQLSCDTVTCQDTDTAIGEIAEKKPNFIFIDYDSSSIDVEQVILFAANHKETSIFCTTSLDQFPTNVEHVTEFLKNPIQKSYIENIINNNSRSDTAQTLDEKMLQSIKDLAGDDDPEFLPNLIRLFFHRAPTIMSEIDLAIHQNDFYKLERSSHSLKGSCGNLGATSMMKICEQLESIGRSETTEGATLLHKKLQTSYTRVKDELEKDWMPKAS